VNVLRRQLLTRGGRCGVRFMAVTESQQRVLGAIEAADHSPTAAARRALVVTRDDERARTLAGELRPLGFAVRREASPGQAGAWLQREETEAVIVDEGLVELDRWSLLQFVRDTAPDVRRLVIASDVRGFRLYYAMKAGLVEGLVEPAVAGDDLARHLMGVPAASKMRRRRAAR
jgi:DNA-binding NtrC family response regulator